MVEVATAFAPNVAVFLVLRALFGIGMGGEWGVGTSLVMEKVPARRRGMLSGLLQEGYAAGYLLAAVAAWFLLDRFGWRVMFLLGGLPALLTLLIRFGIKESEVWRRTKAESWSHLGRALALALEALALSYALDGGDELLFARHAGHVPHLHEAVPRHGRQLLFAGRDADDDRGHRRAG